MAITSINRNVNTLSLTASATIGMDVDQVMCDCTSGAITVTLYPAPGDGALHRVVVEKTDSSGNAVTVTDGTFTFSLPAQYDAVQCELTQAGVWFGVSGFDRSGTGDVEGPSSSTDNAIVRFNGTTGKDVQNSAVIVADTTGLISGTQGVTISGATSGSVAIAATATGGQLTVGTGPTTVTDSAGKILSAALNTVAVAQGGTGASSASITAFNNITGFTASGATGTTSTNLVFSTSPALTTPAIGAATGTSLAATGLIKSSSPTAGIGYATGAGGAVAQGTNRTTGVTLDTITGAITLVSAAGSATPASFTVTNAAVAATDVIIVNQKSGTDLYEIFVTAVGAGSFQITSFTTGGTTTEQPVFNFAVIKGVAA